MAQLITQPRGLLRLTDCLLTQAEEGDAHSLAAVTGRPGGGMVVSGAQSLQLVEHLGNLGFPAPLLADRQKYKGKRRKRASEPFDPNWISRQRRLGLPAIIPDAGYVAEADLSGLRAVLQNSETIDGAVALLALANWWMYDAGLRLLIQELRNTDVPVALVLEHRGDPLAVTRILRGVLEILDIGVTMMMLRCDVSALGLVARGALAAAYGSKSSIRHLYPVSDNGGGGGGGLPKESAFWPAGTALHYRDLLFDAVAASPDDPCWECGCSICAGMRLDRLGMASVEEVRQHNSASLLDLRDEMAGWSFPDRRRWWSQRCRDAGVAHAAVASGHVALQCPKALELWRTMPA
jgi:hypothetical protein